jgi:hypothetical protein
MKVVIWGMVMRALLCSTLVILNEAKNLRTRLLAENREFITYNNIHTYL